MTYMARPVRTDLWETLGTFREWWRAMSPEERERERQGMRDALMAAQIGIDDEGYIWFEVIER